MSVTVYPRIPKRQCQPQHERHNHKRRNGKQHTAIEAGVIRTLVSRTAQIRPQVVMAPDASTVHKGTRRCTLLGEATTAHVLMHGSVAPFSGTRLSDGIIIARCKHDENCEHDKSVFWCCCVPTYQAAVHTYQQLPYGRGSTTQCTQNGNAAPHAACARERKSAARNSGVPYPVRIYCDTDDVYVALVDHVD